MSKKKSPVKETKALWPEEPQPQETTPTELKPEAEAPEPQSEPEVSPEPVQSVSKALVTPIPTTPNTYTCATCPYH